MPVDLHSRDLHAVASLLKLYFRELPSSLLPGGKEICIYISINNLETSNNNIDDKKKQNRSPPLLPPCLGCKAVSPAEAEKGELLYIDDEKTS